MGDKHGDKWCQALPWVLLGRRIQVQPDLDASAASLVFGKAVEIPGQLLGHPGPPLSTVQTRALLEELYKISARPAQQTTSVANPMDISNTDMASHVYVKVAEPQGLSSRFEGPYPIVSRPSRSTVQLRLGSYANGVPRLQEYHWSSCKVAHLRDGAPDGQRPNLGRPKTKPDPQQKEFSSDSTDSIDETGGVDQIQEPSPQKPDSPESSQTPGCPARPVRSTRNPSPRYVDVLTRG